MLRSAAAGETDGLGAGDLELDGEEDATGGVDELTDGDEEREGATGDDVSDGDADVEDDSVSDGLCAATKLTPSSTASLMPTSMVLRWGGKMYDIVVRKRQSRSGPGPTKKEKEKKRKKRKKRKEKKRKEKKRKEKKSSAQCTIDKFWHML